MLKWIFVGKIVTFGNIFVLMYWYSDLVWNVCFWNDVEILLKKTSSSFDDIGLESFELVSGFSSSLLSSKADIKDISNFSRLKFLWILNLEFLIEKQKQSINVILPEHGVFWYMRFKIVF